MGVDYTARGMLNIYYSIGFLQEIAECLQQNAKSEKATAFLIWKALLFSVVALTTISEHLHHRIYFTVANILQSPVHTVKKSKPGQR